MTSPLSPHTWSSWSYDSSGRKNKAKRPIDILIGCPIQQRDWIIDDWFWYVMAACKVADLKPGFIFVMDPKEEPLNSMIHNLCRLNNVDLWVGEVVEEDRTDERDWNVIRYEKMVELRNALLQGVRDVAPPLFLSLDSDILLAPDALKSMVENLSHDEWDAIGGKTYMTHTGKEYPSYGILNDGFGMIRRQEADGVFEVDVIMAIKLMKPKAYAVDYKVDVQGEDIGWSRNCKDACLKLRWDGTYASKHVMRKDDKDKIDVRVGY